MAEELNAIYPAYHLFLSVENAKHALSYSVNPNAYKQSIKKFMDKVLN